MHIEGRYNNPDANKRVTIVGGGFLGRANTQNGTANDTVIVKNSISSVSISTGQGYNVYLGGFMGVNNEYATNQGPQAGAVTLSFENCAATGNLILSGTYDGTAYVGGFMPIELTVTEMKNCYHSGNITASLPTSGISGAALQSVAGIVSFSNVELSTHTDCTTSYTSYAPASAKGVFTNCSSNVTNISDKINSIKATIAANFETDKAATQAAESSYVPKQTTTSAKATEKQTTAVADNTTEIAVSSTIASIKSGCKSNVVNGGIIAFALVTLFIVLISKKRAKSNY
jgi:hypothetical protein